MNVNTFYGLTICLKLLLPRRWYMALTDQMALWCQKHGARKVLLSWFLWFILRCCWAGQHGHCEWVGGNDHHGNAEVCHQHVVNVKLNNYSMLHCNATHYNTNITIHNILSSKHSYTIQIEIHLSVKHLSIPHSIIQILYPFKSNQFYFNLKFYHYF